MPVEPLPEELDVVRRTAGLQLEYPALAVMSNIWRVAQAFGWWVESDLLSYHCLSFSTFSMLFILWTWGPMDIAEIAKRQSLALSAVRGALGKLESDGLAGDCRDTPDHAAIQVTKKGEALMKRLFPVPNQGEQKFALCMTREEQESLVGLLRKIVRQRPTQGDLHSDVGGKGAAIKGPSLPLQRRRLGNA